MLTNIITSKAIICRYVLITIFFFFSSNVNADIGFQVIKSPYRHYVNVIISGKITEKDLDDLKIATERRSRLKPYYTFILNSEGGDLDTAMGIGKIISNLESRVIVQEHSQCLSECVFILAGGATRYVLGTVGIHRPYESHVADGSIASIGAKYELINKSAKDFFKDVNIKISLYDAMMRIPPKSMRLLSPEELEYFGLSTDNPYSDEVRIIDHTKSIGITREEYGLRQAKAEKICGETESITAYDKCRSNILHKR